MDDEVSFYIIKSGDARYCRGGSYYGRGWAFSTKLSLHHAVRLRSFKVAQAEIAKKVQDLQAQVLSIQDGTWLTPELRANGWSYQRVPRSLTESQEQLPLWLSARVVKVSLVETEC
jgi:hypothetical protein